LEKTSVFQTLSELDLQINIEVFDFLSAHPFVLSFVGVFSTPIAKMFFDVARPRGVVV
jgi:hypothetical protein